LLASQLLCFLTDAVDRGVFRRWPVISNPCAVSDGSRRGFFVSDFQFARCFPRILSFIFKGFGERFRLGFSGNINETVVVEDAKDIVESGLSKAGYEYYYLDGESWIT
jgi:hypothetical protein